MTAIKILQPGAYSMWEGDKARSQQLAKGDVVDVPEWYANSLEDTGLVDLVDVKVLENAGEVSSFASLDATEGAVKLAAEENVDLSEIEGTGSDGRRTLSDVRNFLAEAPSVN